MAYTPITSFVFQGSAYTPSTAFEFGNNLIAQSLVHGQVLGHITLIPGVSLAVDQVGHGHTLSSPAVFDPGVLTVQNATHGHALQSPPLIPPVTLTVQNATHGHALQSIMFQTNLTLQIPVQILVVSFPSQIRIPVGIAVYETLTLQAAVSIDVNRGVYTLSAGVQLSTYQATTLQMPVELEIYPSFSSGTGGQGVGSVISLPTGQTQSWSVKAILDGDDVSARLTGSVSIDMEESSSVVAVFALRPEVGTVNPYKWVRAIYIRTPAPHGMDQRCAFVGRAICWYTVA